MIGGIGADVVAEVARDGNVAAGDRVEAEGDVKDGVVATAAGGAVVDALGFDVVQSTDAGDAGRLHLGDDGRPVAVSEGVILFAVAVAEWVRGFAGRRGHATR